jgi:hypothetical protein
MEDTITTVDFSPKSSYPNLARGVHGFREYRVYDHERAAWVNYVEFVYRTSIGVAHICLGPGKSLRSGMETALRLLQDDRNPFLKEPDGCGVVNSLKNYEDLASSIPLSLVIARSGAYTERSVGRILDTFTGYGLIPPSRLHRLMADRPALTFPYHPFADKSYRRIKPACVPPEIKMKYATPLGTEQNEVLLAGKITYRWSDTFYERVLKDVDYTLWIAEGEKKALCLSMIPLLLGTKADVIGIPGVWMWGKKQSDGTWKLAPELSAYTYATEDRRRMVGIAFDNDSWKNPKVADALLKLCDCLRSAGAMVFVAVIPPGSNQKGIDDYFLKHCVTEQGFNFEPLMNLLDKAIYVDKKLTVSYPSPEVACRIRTLIEKADEFEEIQREHENTRLSEISESVVAEVVSSIGMYMDPQSSDLNGGQFLASFRELPADTQLVRWGGWMVVNPFQVELDRQLDRCIPGIFRGRAAQELSVTLGQVLKEHLKPEQLKDLNYY